MRILAIPDIHTKWRTAQSIIDSTPTDRIILLGDYFDDFHDSAQTNAETAQWLKDIIHRPNVIALLGNHEFNYYKYRVICKCSGFSRHKLDAINRVLNASDWSMLKPFYLDNDNSILFSHAGATAYVYANPITKELDTQKLQQKYETPGSIFTIDWDQEVGTSRGGIASYGGLFWCDFNIDFEPIDDIIQVFGHTPGDEPRSRGNSVCLDTHLHHVLLIDSETHEMKVKEINHDAEPNNAGPY